MKVLKTIGAAGAILLGTAALGAWVYNEARWEKMNREFWQEQMDKSRLLKEEADTVKIYDKIKKVHPDSTKIVENNIRKLNLIQQIDGTIVAPKLIKTLTKFV